MTEKEFVEKMMENNSKYLLNITDEAEAKRKLGSFLYAAIGFMKHKNNPSI